MGFPFCPQNIENEEFTAKVFQNDGLRSFSGVYRERIFWRQFRKVLILRMLGAENSSQGLQNIVKERLTRKIFQTNNLALPLQPAIPAKGEQQ